MENPGNFERLLSEAEARKYISQHATLRRVLIEIGINKAKQFGLNSADMRHYEAVRTRIQAALSEHADERNASAANWISFLKPRVEMLEYSANYYSNSAAYIAGATVLIAFVVALFFGARAGATMAGLGGVFAIGHSMIKICIDRRRAWYNYILAHLEAIRAGAVFAAFTDRST